MRVFFAVIVLSALSATPALANKPEYCAAYGKDFANARTRDKVLWQHKYDIAVAACMAEPQQAEIIKPKIMAAAEPAMVIPPEPVVKLKAEKLVSGSPEWIDYCTQKYNSFNAKTGTYMSLTGVERKCLVN
jgi:BA14K-like protein